MSISGRSFRSSQVVRIDARILAKLATRAYDECWLDYCCDPTEMAERLGLKVEMTDGNGEIVGNTLLCPLLKSRRSAMEVVYRLLGGYLLNRNKRWLSLDGAANAVADELMLPKCVAAQIESTELLPIVQRYVTLDSLRRIYLQHRPLRRTEPSEEASVSRVTV